MKNETIIEPLPVKIEWARPGCLAIFEAEAAKLSSEAHRQIVLRQGREAFDGLARGLAEEGDETSAAVGLMAAMRIHAPAYARQFIELEELEKGWLDQRYPGMDHLIFFGARFAASGKAGAVALKSAMRELRSRIEGVTRIAAKWLLTTAGQQSLIESTAKNIALKLMCEIAEQLLGYPKAAAAYGEPRDRSETLAFFEESISPFPGSSLPKTDFPVDVLGAVEQTLSSIIGRRGFSEEAYRSLPSVISIGSRTALYGSIALGLPTGIRTKE